MQEYIFRDISLDNTDKFIQDMEEAVKKCFDSQIRDTIDKLQNEYNADALKAGEYIQKFHPKVWKRVEKDWDVVFRDMDIECRVDVKIRSRGLILIR